MTLPAWRYGDPGVIAEADELHNKGCSVCVRAQFVFGQATCSANLKFPACKTNRRHGYQLLPAARGDD